MIYVLASIKVNPGSLTGFLDIFKANATLVLQEKGCLEYVPAVDFNTGLSSQALDETVVTVIEKWEDAAALQSHLRSAHMKDYRQKVSGMVESVTLKVLAEA